MSTPKTVLFDLDGTLLDTERDFTRILNEQLAYYGHSPVSKEQVRNTVSSGASALIKLGFAIDEKHAAFDQYLEELLSRYQQRIPETECILFPGIAELLAALNKAKCQWGIVTNKPSRFTLPLVEMFADFEHSQVLVCADQLRHSKPDPEGILNACKALQCSPQQTLYVGDHPKDVEASRRAGAKSIGVRWGYVPEEHPIETWQADYVISRPDEILALATGA